MSKNSNDNNQQPIEGEAIHFTRTPPENATLSATTPQPNNHKALSVADKTPMTDKCVRI